MKDRVRMIQLTNFIFNTLVTKMAAIVVGKGFYFSLNDVWLASKSIRYWQQKILVKS